jgi:hypothetical protein
MSNEYEELFAIITGAIDAGMKRELVELRIQKAHRGSPDGNLVTNENLHLFRVYRNHVAGKASVLVDAALAHRAEEN